MAVRCTFRLSGLGKFSTRSAWSSGGAVSHRIVAKLISNNSLAAAHQLTAYDAAYLDLAKRLSLPLATRDDDLRRAALNEGIRIL